MQYLPECENWGIELVLEVVRDGTFLTEIVKVAYNGLLARSKIVPS
jgi:hypothetical protein